MYLVYSERSTFYLENINRMGVKIPAFLHKVILICRKK